MEFTFLLPLTIGLIVGYKAWGSRHDIAHLAVTFSAISLLTSLLLAPWEVQIILLILTAIIAKVLWENFDNKNSLQQSETSENQDKELHYRGISYDTKKIDTPINNTEKTIKCYRGIDYESSGASAQKTNETPDKVIKYRGVDIKTKIKD